MLVDIRKFITMLVFFVKKMKIFFFVDLNFDNFDIPLTL